MATLSTKVKLYLVANSKTWDAEKDNIEIMDNADGNGPFINIWNVDGLAEPTADQIASYETAGNTAETLSGVRKTRAVAYPELKEQLDLLYKDLVAGKVDATGEWAKKIKKVKDDNPKG